MSYWPAFIYKGIHYSTHHLDAIDLEIVRSASADQPEKVYQLRIKFSHHLFTDPKSAIPILISNAGGRDERPICFKRYHTSFAAVELINQMGKSIKKFHFAKEDNFLVLKAPTCSLIESRTRENRTLHVYFRLRKYKKIDGWIEVYVESAYIAPKKGNLQPTSIYKALEHFMKTGKRLREPPKHFSRR
ncbi:MAG: hypothetical protein HUJ13_05695 [Hydrogenovibrio crunogenus]|nr:hypothetical protein [Hydrogenovibrio crunogenus]